MNGAEWEKEERSVLRGRMGMGGGILFNATLL